MHRNMHGTHVPREVILNVKFKQLSGLHVFKTQICTFFCDENNNFSNVN